MVQGALQFRHPSHVSCSLPDGLHFAAAVAADRGQGAWLAKPPGGACMATQSDAGYLHLSVTEDGLISVLAFLGPGSQLTSQRLVALIGLPATVLSADLQAEVLSGQVRPLLFLRVCMHWNCMMGLASLSRNANGKHMQWCQ